MANARIESKQQHMANFVKGPQEPATTNRAAWVWHRLWAGEKRCFSTRVTPHSLAERGVLAFWLAFAVIAILLYPPFTKAADTLSWRTNQSGVSADIQSARLVPVLERVAEATGWRVFLEPGLTRNVSAKFKNQPVGEALHLLLGDLNFGLVPETNGPSKLFVFRTAQKNATQLIRPADGRGKIIPNELIVRLKPGAKIDEIARLLGAKVVGRIDGLNAYRLRFDDEEATEAARTMLSTNPEVASVENNYSIDRPPVAGGPPPGGMQPIQLQLKPASDGGPIIVGVVDTPFQPLCDNLDSFMLKPISIAGDPQLDPGIPTHGTSMAETVLRSLQAATKGITSVQILPVDVYGPNAATSTFDVANGIVAAVNGGAKVINLSLGSQGDSPVLHDVIQAVAKRNIPIFAAAGNEPVTTPFYPAAYPEVMAVTAVDNGQLAPYANRGSFVSLGAPGTSLFCFNGQSYYAEGTSAASAFTSGMAAGYMDATHGGVAQMKTFINQNFGVKIVPKQ